MSDKATTLLISEAMELKPKRHARLVKATMAALALIYTVNGAGIAVGYANAGPMDSDDLVIQIADVAWVGASWPLVVHDMVSADDLSRIGPLSEPGT